MCKHVDDCYHAGGAPTTILALLQPLAIPSDVLGILKSEGITDMDTLADMDTSDLLEMGICPADVSTILRAVTHYGQSIPKSYMTALFFSKWLASKIWI